MADAASARCRGELSKGASKLESQFAANGILAQLSLVRGQSGFDKVRTWLNEDTVVFEARRSLSGGNCFECDNCYGICPDNAMIKQDPGAHFQFNFDFCMGCGMWAAECPCGAIKMVPKSI